MLMPFGLRDGGDGLSEPRNAAHTSAMELQDTPWAARVIRYGFAIGWGKTFGTAAPVPTPWYSPNRAGTVV